MTKSSPLAFAGILCIFGYGYAILPGCTDAPGYVHLIWEHTQPDSAEKKGTVYEITGASGAPPPYRISERPPSGDLTTYEKARFPVHHCTNALQMVLDRVRRSGYKYSSPLKFSVRENKFKEFFDAIQTGVASWIQVNVLPLDQIQVCYGSSPGYVHIAYVHITKPGEPPFYCIRIFESSREVPNTLPKFELVTLPFMKILPSSPYVSYHVTDCERAISRLYIAMSVEYPRGYWKDYIVYGQDCLRPNLSEDFSLPHTKLLFDEAIEDLVVKPSEITPTESTSTAPIED